MADGDDFAELARKFRALAENTRDPGLRAEFLKLAQETEKLPKADEDLTIVAQNAIRE